MKKNVSEGRRNKENTGRLEKRTVLWVAALAAFLTPFMGSAVNIALPAIDREFSAGALMLNWIATLYLLSAAIFLLPVGKASDILGRKKFFLGGVALFTLASVLSGMATSLDGLLLARVLQGMGSAMMFANGIALVTSVFPPGERGRALGINVAAVYLGLSLGPFLGGVMTQYLGWRSIFFFNVPLGILILVLGTLFLKKEWAGREREPFDFGGSVIYATGLALLIYGFSKIPEPSGYLWSLGGIIFLSGFVFFEKSRKFPLLNLALISKNRVFAFSNLAALINYSATFAVGFLLSLYLQYIGGMSARDAGVVLVVQPLIMTIISPVAGRLSDRYEPRLVASAGMALSAIGLLSFAFIHEETRVPGIIAGLALLGFGFALFSSPNTNAIMGSVERKYYGLASAFTGTMRLTGQMLSMGIVLILFSIFIGQVQINPENFPAFLKSVRLAFVISGVMCVFGIVASMVRGKVH